MLRAVNKIPERIRHIGGISPGSAGFFRNPEPVRGGSETRDEGSTSGSILPLFLVSTTPAQNSAHSGIGPHSFLSRPQSTDFCNPASVDLNFESVRMTDMHATY